MEGRPKGIGPQHVLVVEDDDAITKLLRIVLEQNGYVVRVATTAANAITSMQDEPPSLVLLDLGLPDGHGFDVLRWVRTDAGLSTPVIVLTAYRQDENVARAFDLGANDFVAKPFRPKELVSRIQRVLAI